MYQPQLRSLWTFHIDAEVNVPAGRLQRAMNMKFIQGGKMGGLENAHIDSGDGECGAGAPSLLVEAERQLAAFHQAVLSLHGPGRSTVCRRGLAARIGDDGYA